MSALWSALAAVQVYAVLVQAFVQGLQSVRGPYFSVDPNSQKCLLCQDAQLEIS